MKLDINPITGKFDITADSSIESAATYTSTVPTTEAHGGIEKGTIFEDVPVSVVLDQILHKPVAPTLTISPLVKAGVYELGASFENRLSAVVKLGSAQLSKVELYVGSTLTATNKTTPGGGSITFTETTNATTTYKVVATDTNGLTASASLSYTFLRPVYYGLLADVPTSVDDLTLAVPSAKSGTFTASYAAFDSKRLVFATPGTMSKALNPSLFDITASFSKTTLSVKCRDGQTVSYNVYYSEPSSQLAAYPVKYTYTTLG